MKERVLSKTLGRIERVRRRVEEPVAAWMASCCVIGAEVDHRGESILVLPALEQRACVVDPLSLASATGVIGTELGQDQRLVGLSVRPTNERFDDLFKGAPRFGGAVSAIVPVVWVSADEIDDVIAWIPPVGDTGIVRADIADSERPVRHDPGELCIVRALGLEDVV